MTPNALANLDKKIDADEVESSQYIIAEFLDYLRWLAEQDTGRAVVIGDIWTLYYEGIHTGRAWSEVCEDIGLPVREDWS